MFINEGSMTGNAPTSSVLDRISQKLGRDYHGPEIYALSTNYLHREVMPIGDFLRNLSLLHYERVYTEQGSSQRHDTDRANDCVLADLFQHSIAL